jgi:UDP-glucose 4-epimerase
MNVIVTGAAGYIGGHVALQLHDAGHTVIGIDRRPCPLHLQGVMQFLQADFDSDESFKKIIDSRPDAVVHCAGTSLVGPSMLYPSDYYKNNVVKTLNLLSILLAAVPKTRFIFSSSAATYGTPVTTPCYEHDPSDPISPYGESKLMIEKILQSYHRAYGLDYVAFRYFNACGADPVGRHGQEPNATHIIARVLESIRDDQEFTLYGVDYPTHNGTCVRDYVHVSDIARAHVLSLDQAILPGIYNLGSCTGTSCQEIISMAETVTGKKLKIIVGNPRPGDPPTLTASSDKFDSLVTWRQHDLYNMVQHAWSWYNQNLSNKII